MYNHLLARVALAPDLDDEDRELVLSAATLVEARRITHSRFQPDAGAHEDWLLTRVLNGNNLAGPPITCLPRNGTPKADRD